MKQGQASRSWTARLRTWWLSVATAVGSISLLTWAAWIASIDPAARPSDIRPGAARTLHVLETQQVSLGAGVPAPLQPSRKPEKSAPLEGQKRPGGNQAVGPQQAGGPEGSAPQ